MRNLATLRERIETAGYRVTDDVPSGGVLNGTPFGTSWLCTSSSPSAFRCAYTNAASIAGGTTLPITKLVKLLAEWQLSQAAVPIGMLMKKIQRQP